MLGWKVDEVSARFLLTWVHMLDHHLAGAGHLQAAYCHDPLDFV